MASQHNSNNSTIANAINGGLDNTNLTGSAGITYANLTLTGSLVNADLANLTITGAKIANTTIDLTTKVTGALPDSNLAQITTASKVSGTAITGLASLPSGAGVIPTANLPTLGAMTLISATTISGAATTGNISITSGNTYLVNFNFVNASGSNPIFRLIFNADSGSHYGQILTGFTSASATVFTVRGAANALTTIDLSRAVTNSSTTGLNGYFYIQQVGTASQTYRIWGQSTYDGSTSSTFEIANIMGNWNNAANATSFAISPSTGNIDGTVYLYKLALS